MVFANKKEKKKRNKNNALYNLRTNNNGEAKEKKVFIKKCPVGDCEGFLSSSWKCGVCSTWVCPECFEIKGTNFAGPPTSGGYIPVVIRIFNL